MYYDIINPDLNDIISLFLLLSSGVFDRIVIIAGWKM
jgi:hypothetical protein